MGKKSIGFGAQIESNKDIDKYKVFEELLPQDLLKFGLIPELIGRLPIITSLNQLTESALIDIITKPKNALLKQYVKLFKMDDVELSVEEDALNAIVESAVERKTGARGLRAIMENVMMDAMYEVPSNKDIVKCVITKDVVTKQEKPKYIMAENTK